MTGELRVLLVEDSPTDAKLVLHELKQNGHAVYYERVETAEDMRAALARSEWDLVLSDWSMPKFNAAAALSVLKEAGLDLPFIIVSGPIGEETAVEAMRAGARDYVLKDKLVRLAPAIERELREYKERVARRDAEAALRESEARFSRLSESGVIGIASADLHGNVHDANDTYLRMIGYTREELRQSAISWARLTPPEFAHLAERAEEQLRTVGFAPPWETEVFHKDGQRIPLLMGGAMLAYPQTVAFTVDLTERRKAEVGREQAERALRQSEEQLRQAQKMEAVGRLAGGVAHDFNNVLSVILGYAEFLLAELKASDPLRKDVQEIHDAASRAARLTSQLLMFSRQQVVEPRVVNLREVLTSMDKMLQRILGEDVEFVLVQPMSDSRVTADPSHIEQVILNLVINARDAMPTGGKLTIELTDVELDENYAQSHLPASRGPHVMLAVTDTGTGMDRATQARIFEPFYTTKEQGKGTGLGLSTVFGIVQQSGGSVWVYSELSHGTTFKVYLPKSDGVATELKPQPTPTSLRGSETILLVEDEDQVRAVVSSALSRQGYRVIPARNAGEALLLCEDQAVSIDLLLTDVVMPKMSGPELAARLSATRPGMKIICMSGYTDDSIVRHGVLEAGMTYLQKPVTPTLLATKLREVLDADKSRANN